MAEPLPAIPIIRRAPLLMVPLENVSERDGPSVLRDPRA